VIAEMVPPIIKGEDNEIPPGSVVDERRQVEIVQPIALCGAERNDRRSRLRVAIREAYSNSLRCPDPRGALSCGSPMPGGERIAKPAERRTRLSGFLVASGGQVRRELARNSPRRTVAMRN